MRKTKNYWGCHLFLALVVGWGLAGSPTHAQYLFYSPWEVKVKLIHEGSDYEIFHTPDGNQVIASDWTFGKWLYFFETIKGKEVVLFSLFVPDNLLAVNMTVKVLNENYIRSGKNKWKRYADGGHVVWAALVYNDDIDSYVFVFTTEFAMEWMELYNKPKWETPSPYFYYWDD